MRLSCLQISLTLFSVYQKFSAASKTEVFSEYIFLRKSYFFPLFWVKVVVPNKTKGKQTSLRPASCVDYLRRGISQSGIYKLYDQSGRSYAAYCDMKSELDIAWTIVTSWSTSNRHLAEFRKIPFKYNAPQSEDALNWDLYRLSLARMRFIQTYSTHWRATCSYSSLGIDFRDKHRRFPWIRHV